MARNSSRKAQRSKAELSSTIAVPSYRRDAQLMNGVWLHPSAVSAATELEQWYQLEFRVPKPPPNEG